MRFLTRSLVALIFLALSLGLLGFGAWTIQSTLAERAERQSRPAIARERVVAARVVAIVPGERAPVLAAFGEVRARATLDLRAPQAGRVAWLAPGFETGGAVRAGEVLIRLDPSDAQAALDLARTDLARAEIDARDALRLRDLAGLDRIEAQAQVDLRSRALERRQNLASRGVGAEAAVEEAELALAAARASAIARATAEAQAETRAETAAAQLDRARIALAEAERRLAETEIIAAFDGILSDVAAAAGGTVAPNERLARLIDPAALEVSFRLSTGQYLRLLDEAGDLLPVTGEAALELGGLAIASPIRIARSSPAVGDGQSGRLVFADLLAPRGFRPGDFVTVRLTEPVLPDVALLPASAVDGDGGVLLLTEGDRLVAASVEVLRRQGDEVLVRAADLAGREVVAVRNPLLGEGIRIRPQRDARAAVPVEPEMVQLDPERRAALVARIEQNTMMPEAVRTRILAQLEQERVPAQLLERLEAGGRGG
jgi:multidrug efflux pump subunit AcrA (membrane-fusion protein)